MLFAMMSLPLVDGLRLPWPLTGVQFIEHQSQCIQIALDCGWLAGEELRGHVSWRTRPRTGRGFFGPNRESKISDAGVSTTVKHYVRWLQVPVNYALGVRGRQACTQFMRNLQCLVFG